MGKFSVCPWPVLRFFFFFTILGWCSEGWTQTPSGFGIRYENAQYTEIVNRQGYGNNYPTGNTYTLRFGRNSNNTQATHPILVDFTYNGLTYKAMPKTDPTRPYTRIVINRKPANGITNLNKFTGFFEKSGVQNNIHYFKAEYIDNLEDLINSYVLNRGVDNIFSNNDGMTRNNVERVDLILDGGIVVPAGIPLDRVGMLLMERNGNDNYKVAVITELDETSKVSGLGNLIARLKTNFGQTTLNVTSTVFQKGNNSGDNDIKPDQDLDSQTIAGDFITLSKLGVTAGQIIYGISIFPDDVDANNDLIGLTNVPTTTNGTAGGLDFMGGGGFFIESNTISASLEGRVYHDTNVFDGVIDGIGIGTLNSSNLYAYIIDQNERIVARQLVANDGTFKFPVILLGKDTEYQLLISTQNVSGSTPPTGASLPAAWIMIADGYGTGNAMGTGIEATRPNANLAIPIKYANADSPHITDVRFGLSKNYWMGTETSTDWNVESNWTAGNIPETKDDDVEFATVDNYGKAAENDLYIDKDREIRDLINASDKNLVITTGNQLTIYGTVQDENPSGGTIVVKSDPTEPTGTLIFDNAENNQNVQATVEFYNKAHKCDCGFYPQSWQYFGIPVQSSAFPYSASTVETVNEWSEPTNGNKWISPASPLTAFTGYEIADASTTEPEHIYNFSGTLNVGNASVELTRTAGVNYFGINLIGNSYTAAIPISEAAIDFNAWSGGEKTVYLFNTGTRDEWRKLNGTVETGTKSGQYTAVPFNLAGQGELPGQIPSMHTFMINAGAGGSLNLNYHELEKNEMFDGTAWRSGKKETDQLPHIVLEAVGTTSVDRVWLFENGVSTRSFDNGWDGYKIEEGGLVQLYVSGEGGEKYQVATVPEFDGTKIGLKPDNDDSYTLNLSVTPDVEARNLFLYDRVTGNNYAVRDSAEYMISGVKVAFNDRFVITSGLKETGVGASSLIELLSVNSAIYVTNLSDEDCVVVVYDIAGRVLLKKPVSKMSSAYINTPGSLPNGLYIVQAKSLHYSKTAKISVY
ncbi:T9SS type A sorting domain-containing protein [Parabacteroides sp. Marseille-P3160]|uniref:T9SS type A sorting domain-containing protein n=1 Tax=Parabacteroides sp. Marseille-P3160 TaxID=1917887 RepID=UPI0011183DD5|nr:T9SS type A sorting domain-containing protein [Parabacteroides sp. Marseille-P3160]